MEITSAPGPDVFDYGEIYQKIQKTPVPTDFTQRALRNLRLQTILTAGIWEETSGWCEGGPIRRQPEAVTTCIVTYRGLEVPWSVKYRAPGYVVEYNAMPLKTVLAARSAHHQIWEMARSLKATKVRCDEIPDYSLAEPGKATDYQCQALASPPVGGAPRWRNFSLAFTEQAKLTLEPVRPGS